MNDGLMAIGRQFRKPLRRAIGQCERRGAGLSVYHTDVLHIDAAIEPCANSFGKSLLSSETFCIGSSAGEGALGGLGAFNFGEGAFLESLAMTVENALNTLDIA